MMSARRHAWFSGAAILCALLGLAASIWGYLNTPQAFFTAWLSAFWYWLAMPLGATALLMTLDLTGGKWQVVARLPLEAAAATMPLFILAFLPVVAGMGELYSWSRPDVAASLPNRWYLDPGFFAIRAAVYFIVWNFCALRSMRGRGSAWLSGIGLMLMGYAVVFAGIDWVMSTEPRWFSSVYGMMIGAGTFIASLSLILVVVTLAGPQAGIEPEIFARHLAMLATLLLAVDIFWAYTAFSQYLIIWEENLSSEIPWYVERMREGWRQLIYVIAAMHFVAPFVLLLSTPAKRSRAIVFCASAAILPGHLLQVWWLVLPPFSASGFTWLHPVVAVGLGGLWFLIFLWRLRGRSFTAAGSAAAAEGAGHG